jgi:hypothetical protein
LGLEYSFLLVVVDVCVWKPSEKHLCGIACQNIAEVIKENNLPEEFLV